MFNLAVILAKITRSFIRIFSQGSGNTWPGHLALLVFPHLLKVIKNNIPEKVIMISGTNGKTTTAKLVTHILENSGKKVLHNSSGANLVNGVISTILLGDKNCDIGVFEVDEFSLPTLLTYINPDVLALLNLSRDQLDRHWETDIVLDKWSAAIKMLEKKPVLLVDKEQHEFEELRNSYEGKLLSILPDLSLLKDTALLGSFNAKNIDCALKISGQLGITKETALSALVDFQYAFGRGELVKYMDKEFRVLLAKNPASLNNNLQLLIDNPSMYDSIAFVLNDNVPDGHDISWIYDIDSVLLARACKEKAIFVSGNRALDMTVRLQYANVSVAETDIHEDLNSMFTSIINSSAHQTFVLPNYSAMLEVRKTLLGRRIL